MSKKYMITEPLSRYIGVRSYDKTKIISLENIEKKILKIQLVPLGLIDSTVGSWYLSTETPKLHSFTTPFGKINMQYSRLLDGDPVPNKSYETEESFDIELDEEDYKLCKFYQDTELVKSFVQNIIKNYQISYHLKSKKGIKEFDDVLSNRDIIKEEIECGILILDFHLDTKKPFFIKKIKHE